MNPDGAEARLEENTETRADADGGHEDRLSAAGFPASALAPLIAKRGREEGPSRFVLCLGISLALHAAAALFFPVVYQDRGGASASKSSVYVRIGPGDSRAVSSGRAPVTAERRPDEGFRPRTSEAENGDAWRAPAPDAKPRAADSEGVGAFSPSVPDGGAPEAPDASELDTRQAAGGLTAASDGAPESTGTGSGLSAENAAASLLLSRAQAALRYPEAARIRGVEGVTGLRIELDGAGGLAGLRVARTSGSALLDKAAIDAVRAGLPVPNPSGAPLAFELSVRFSLQSAVP